MVERRTRGEPLEQILGWAEFCGLQIRLAPGVFVPRARTEFLVTQALALTGEHAADQSRGGAIVAVDVCCGSGAIGAALTKALEPLELYATDLDPVAVACARANLQGGEAKVLAGDLYEPLPGKLGGRVDLLLANAPYVPSDEIGVMPREARLHEHAIALDGGRDGLEVQRRIANEAPGWLVPGGHLLMETSETQATETAEIVAGAGLVARRAHSDELDATVIIGRLG